MTNEIISNVSNVISKVGCKFQKHSPEILAVTGTVGIIASAVMACKATTKVSTVLEDTKEQIDAVHSALEDEQITEEAYSEEDSKKDMAIIYVQTGMKMAKLYAPSVILGVASIGCMLTSNNILRKRNVALAAAYATVDKGFKEYRSRVIDRFGEAVDRELKYNIKAQKISETVTDEETGKQKKVKKTIEVADSASGYARFFEEYISVKNEKTGEVSCYKNTYWNDAPEYNLMFLKAQQQYANDILHAKGRLFLNDVYKMLGLPESKAGQVVGWVYNDENPVGDNYVDFGIYNNGSENYSDFIYGSDGAILLDFNVDGNIWELM